MKPRSLRSLLKDSSAGRPLSSDAERREWQHVRDAVAEICLLSTADVAGRLNALRASGDGVDARIADLVILHGRAGNFLETPPARPKIMNHPTYPPGWQIGPYRIVSLVGEGGMGRVYVADDTRLLRRVALKVLTSDRVPGASLLREARMAARLHHANIATIYDVLEVDGQLHIVMEYLEGRTLARLLAEDRLDVVGITKIFDQILTAVGHAHAAGVVHCDLKPANVFVMHRGDVKVLDFGLARLDAASPHPHTSMALAGTPQYMAPERLAGVRPDARSDIFSLGVILSDMLHRITCGASADSEMTTIVGRGYSDSLGVLREISARAVAHDPAMRYKSAEEMAAALRLAPDPADLPVAKLYSKRWLSAAAGLSAVSALLVSLLGLPLRTSGPNPVLAVSLAAADSDPMSGYVAAALQQILEHSVSGARDLTVVRQGMLGPDSEDVGATHVLSGTVARSGQQLRVVLSLARRDGEVLASNSESAGVDRLPALGAAVLSAADIVMQRAQLPVDRRSVGDATPRQALSVDPQAFEDYAQAREYMRTPDVRDYLDHAISLLTRASMRDPSFALAHAGLAEAYWQKYQATRDVSWTDRARAAALEALRLNPDNPIVRYTLALIYRGMGRLEDALSEVSKAVAVQPANDDLYRLRGELHADLGRIENAITELAAALKLRPGFWENHRTAGRILYESGRVEESIPYFLRVTELRPSSASAFQALGTAYHAANFIPEALRAYERAIALAPSANSYSNIGKIHFDNRQFDQARQAYEESIRIRPRAAVTHRNLGDTLTMLGSKARAKAEYSTAIALAEDDLKVNPSSVEALSLQALCHAKIGNRNDARRLAARVLASPTIPPSVQYRIGVAQVLIGEASGVETVAAALEAGFSRSEAATDLDLAKVRDDPRLKGAIGIGLQ